MRPRLRFELDGVLTESRRVNEEDSPLLYDQLLLGRQDGWLTPRVRHWTIEHGGTIQDARRDILAIVLFEDNSHIFGSNFGDLLDERKEAECC